MSKEKQQPTKDEIIKGLMRDAVELSLSAQRILDQGSFPISAYDEIKALVTMTNYVLDNYLEEKTDEQASEKAEKA